MSTTVLDIDTTSLPDLSIYTRKNIPLETLIELRAKKLSYSQVAKLAGCTKANAIIRLKAVQADIDNVPRFKKHKADLIAIKQSKILNQLTESDIKKANLRDKVVAFGILEDKYRLETGQSTANISIFARSIEQSDPVPVLDAIIDDSLPSEVGENTENQGKSEPDNG